MTSSWFSDPEDSRAYNAAVEELNERIAKFAEAERDISEASVKEIDEAEHDEKKIFEAIKDLRKIVEPRYKNMVILNMEMNTSLVKLMRIVRERMTPGEAKFKVVEEIGDKMREFENAKTHVDSIAEHLEEIKLMERGLVLAMREVEAEAELLEREETAAQT